MDYHIIDDSGAFTRVVTIAVKFPKDYVTVPWKVIGIFVNGMPWIKGSDADFTLEYTQYHTIICFPNHERPLMDGQENLLSLLITG